MATTPATADQVTAAYADNKLAQVLYHDWEAQTYDGKWSISFDQRCIDYARDRFEAITGAPDPLPYGTALELGAGTGFFSLNLKQAGVLDDVHVTDLSPGMVEAAKAKDLIFSGRFVSADEALAIGLVDEVVEAEDVYAAARRRMQAYVGGPAYALRAAKEVIDRGLEVDLDTALDMERAQFAALFATRDREIGMKSFVENGPGKAKFEGA
jgi:hypothetical protein